MGWRSTMNITREDALLIILKHVYKATDEQLANMLMECQVYDLNNFSIVGDYLECPDGRNYSTYNNPFE